MREAQVRYYLNNQPENTEIVIVEGSAELPRAYVTYDAELIWIPEFDGADADVSVVRVRLHDESSDITEIRDIDLRGIIAIGYRQ